MNKEENIEQFWEKIREWFLNKGIDAQRFPLYDSAVELVADVETRQLYDDFCSEFSEKCIYENEILSNRYKLFRVEEVDVYAYYTAGDERIRVICSKHTEYPFVMECDDYNDDIKVAVLNMSYCEQSGSGNGMCMVLTLGDGRFVIYDGGFKESDGTRLFQYLNENNIREDGITIAAWVLTHGHEDHYGAFVHFTKKYSETVKVQYFVLNPILNCREREDFLIGVPDMIRKNYTYSKILIPHSGMKFQFNNLQMEVVFTHEDVLPQAVAVINDASIITRLSANGKTILVMGDCQFTTPLVQRALGKYVKSDILQVPHHGDSGGSKDFYDLVDPETVVYCTSSEKFAKAKSKDWYLAPNHYLLNGLHVKNVIVADDGIQTLVINKE